MYSWLIHVVAHRLDVVLQLVGRAALVATAWACEAVVTLLLLLTIIIIIIFIIIPITSIIIIITTQTIIIMNSGVMSQAVGGVPP